MDILRKDFLIGTFATAVGLKVSVAQVWAPFLEKVVRVGIAGGGGGLVRTRTFRP